jgi:hypothetical protein
VSATSREIRAPALSASSPRGVAHPQSFARSTSVKPGCWCFASGFRFAVALHPARASFTVAVLQPAMIATSLSGRALCSSGLAPVSPLRQSRA